MDRNAGKTMEMETGVGAKKRWKRPSSNYYKKHVDSVMERKDKIVEERQARISGGGGHPASCSPGRRAGGEGARSISC